jgi:hypothetical protein
VRREAADGRRDALGVGGNGVPHGDDDGNETSGGRGRRSSRLGTPGIRDDDAVQAELLYGIGEGASARLAVARQAGIPGGGGLLRVTDEDDGDALRVEAGRLSRQTGQESDGRDERAQAVRSPGVQRRSALLRPRVALIQRMRGTIRVKSLSRSAGRRALTACVSVKPRPRVKERYLSHRAAGWSGA